MFGRRRASTGELSPSMAVDAAPRTKNNHHQSSSSPSPSPPTQSQSSPSPSSWFPTLSFKAPLSRRKSSITTNKVVPITEERHDAADAVNRAAALRKYAAQKPVLDWGPAWSGPVDGTASSAPWFSVRNVINICLQDRSGIDGPDACVSFVIESDRAWEGDGDLAIGYFFTLNPVSHAVDLTYHVKDGDREHRVVYNDVVYFGLAREMQSHETLYLDTPGAVVENSKFIVSNEWQDKALRTCVNLCHPMYADVLPIVDLANDFVQRHRPTRAAAPAMPMLALCRPRHTGTGTAGSGRGAGAGAGGGAEDSVVVDDVPPDTYASLPATVATPLCDYDFDDLDVCGGGGGGVGETDLQASSRFTRLGLERIVVVDPATVTPVAAI